MKIFTAEQIRAWDHYTIQHEPISSIDLMERAAKASTDHILKNFPRGTPFHVLCGPGNNGGDGLAIARLLFEAGQPVIVYVSEEGSTSEDHRTNLTRWKDLHALINKPDDFVAQTLTEGCVIIDALFGTGNLRSIKGSYAEMINHVNRSGLQVVSIDLPSGMRADEPTIDQVIVKATITLTLGCWKLALLMPENGPFIGEVHLLPLGLHPGYASASHTPFQMMETEDIRSLLQPRDPFAHKGTFGTAMLLAGSKNMMGAALLSATGCLRSGAGKLICRISTGGMLAMQTGLPEAICSPDPDPDHLTVFPELGGVDAIGIGPGLGQQPETDEVVWHALEASPVPRIFDADALNTIARKGWHDKLSRNCAITPHIGEFHRLFHAEQNGFSRIKTAMEFSTAREVCVIIKGRYSFLSTPGGQGYFNPTGNPGMAKAGSGDVLTGMILALLAQKYSVDAACRMAMYLHGLAGDLTRNDMGEAGMLASDLVLRIGKAFGAILRT
ncbi:MAG: NAD(P)H-hydrate dehydratase [Sphingobacteriales bacterium]|nr:MAG: NAD(P)H-hydrate dehydratase [Sphingobacteriales bacterium]